MKNIVSHVFKLTVTLSILAFASSAQAQFIQFGTPTYATCGGGACDAQYQTAVDTVLSTFESEVNAQAGTGDLSIDQYFGGVSNSMAMAGAGQGVVYGNDFSLAIGGFNLGLGGTLADGQGIFDVVRALSAGDSVRGIIVGGAMQASATLGINAGVFLKSPILWGMVDPKRLKGYISFMKLDKEFTGFGSAAVTSFSAMGQYQILPGKSWALRSVKWEGVNVSSGLRYGKMALTGAYSTTVTQSESIAVGAQNPTVTLTTPLAVNLDVDSTTFAIPFEGSTSVRLGYIFSIYLGMGVDMAFGSTSGGVTGTDDTVTVGHSNDGGLLPGNTTVGYTVDTGFASGSGKPSFVNARGFGGLQVELGVMNLTFGVQKAIFAGRYAANVGANLYW